MKLKPCPFCGEKLAMYNETQYVISEDIVTVDCENSKCVLNQVQFVFDNEKQAVTAMNKRAK